MSSHPHFLWTDLFRKDKLAQRSLTTLLKENILFCTLTTAELKYLTGIVYERIFQPQETIFNENDRGIGMYLITKGRVAIKSLSAQGDILVTYLAEGSFFGELALVEDDSLRSATAVALEHTAAVGLFKPDLIEIMERKPAMGVKILFQLSTVLGARLVETTAKIMQLQRDGLEPKTHEKIP